MRARDTGAEGEPLLFEEKVLSKVFDGVRVVEVAEYVMVPAAAAVLADWGADVIKVEHAHRGDPVRGLTSWGVPPGTGGFATFVWEAFNRGKRSVGLDLAVPEGRVILMDLVRGADVFLTNFLPETRRKLMIDVEDIRAVNPKVIYGRGTAHGPTGADADRGGFDGVTYWQRSGAGMHAMPAGTTELITLPAPGFGDCQAGAAFAGGIAAALFRRERTGEGAVVDCSLLSAGMWAMQAALLGANISGQETLPRNNRMAASSPLTNHYRTSDDRFVALAMLQSDRYWPELCRLLGREDLATDARFATIGARAANNVACVQELDRIFAAQPVAYWVEVLSRQDGQWTVVQPVTALNTDQQAWDNGYIQAVDYGDGRELNMVSSPVQFDLEAPKLRPAPEQGVDTERVLHEDLNLGWDRIVELKDKGAIR